MRRLFFLLGWLCPFFVNSQCLSGTYTIGGASPDYPTMTSAATALSANGVCGPVVFNIRSGVYNEQVFLTNIPGASYMNPITFQSEALDSTAVIIEYGSTTNINYHVVKVSGTPHVSFVKLHVRNTGTVYTNAINFTGSIGCAVRNCIVEALSAPSNQTAACVYAASTATDSLSISNCRFLGNYRGFSTNTNVLAGNYLALSITGCVFEKQAGVSIYVRQGNRTVIQGNTVLPDTMASGADGIVLTQSSFDDTVRNNKVVAPGYALSVSASSNALVCNNFFTTTGDAAFNLTSSSAEFFHNTCVSRGAANTSVVQATVMPTRLNKNIFFHSNGGPVYNLQVSSYPVVYSDQNICYTAGAVFGILNSTVCQNLGQWINLTGMDFDSRFSPPQFVSATDYHVTADFSQNLATSPLPWVPFDIDGDARNSMPFPGADETAIVIAAYDASAVIVSQPALSPICGGLQQFGIVIRNQGALLLTDVNVHWAVDGIPQMPVAWAGNLAPGDTTTVMVGPVALVAGDSVTVTGWTSQPNFTTDLYPANDSLAYRRYAVRMAGVYTIGGVTPDYTTLTEAVDALIAYGICGPVVFNIRNGIYTERLTIPAINGASDTSTITFRSESGDSTLVTIRSTASSSATNFTILCDGLAYCNFYQLTIAQDGNAYNTALKLANGCVSVDISRCHLAAGGNAGTLAEGAVVYVTGTGGDRRISIDSCRISGGYYGIRLLGNMIRNTYNAVRYCEFTNHSYAALEANSQGKLLVSHNTYLDTAYRIRGFSFTTLMDSCVISYNRISGKMITGVFCSFNNGSDSVPQPTVIYNNMISVQSADTGSTTSSNVLFVNECSDLHILFNNLYNYTPTGTTFYMNALYCSANAVRENLLIENNHIVCEGAGVPMRLSFVQPVQWSSNYNNLFSVSGQLVTYGTTPYPNLAAWQAVAGADLNSHSFHPVFFSDSDLHVFAAQGIDEGNPVTWIADDFDGEPRSTPPDIGADEFSLTPVGPEEQQRIIVYPNPSSAGQHIQITGIEMPGAGFTLTDVTGRVVTSGYLVHDAALISEPLAPGQYFLTVFFGSTRCTAPVIVIY